MRTIVAVLAVLCGVMLFMSIGSPSQRVTVVVTAPDALNTVSVGQGSGRSIPVDIRREAAPLQPAGRGAADGEDKAMMSIHRDAPQQGPDPPVKREKAGLVAKERAKPAKPTKPAKPAAPNGAKAGAKPASPQASGKGRRPPAQVKATAAPTPEPTRAVQAKPEKAPKTPKELKAKPKEDAKPRGKGKGKGEKPAGKGGDAGKPKPPATQPKRAPAKGAGKRAFDGSNLLSLEPPAPFTRIEGMCKTVSDMYPGKLGVVKGRLRWTPEHCKLPTMEELDLKRCFAARKQVILGDSLTRMVAISMGRAVRSPPASMARVYYNNTETTENYYYDFIANTTVDGEWGNGRFHFGWVPTAVNEGCLSYPRTDKAVRTADYVVYGGGMWSLSAQYTPIREFFYALRDRILKIRSRMKPTARLVINPIHWLNYHRCPAEKLCRRCNSGPKVAAYREALTLVAACTGASLLNVTAIVQKAENYTWDGVHYADRFTAVEGDVLAAHMCGGMLLPPPTETCRSEAQVNATIARLHAVPETHIKCRRLTPAPAPTEADDDS
eukprot:TRINITY_DN1181_c0_g1_i2.p1 TRINITY_DN1181_c0_g1~~TRINITY_DN1181_c0_g1_i2.p1  ORF type:complete len:551 (+),score=132.40 TRINITY_DN1181_c0_g1_i2:83-1735(+)